MLSSKLLFGSLTVTGVLAVSLILFFAFDSGASTANPGATLSESEAIEKAKEHALWGGFQGEPLAVHARLTTLEESIKVSDPSARLGRDAYKYGLRPDMPVWMVLMLGQVKLTLPGLPPPGGYGDRSYNNITVVINANTGESIGVTAYPGDVPTNALEYVSQP